ncbi:transposase [Pontibacter rugosus]
MAASSSKKGKPEHHHTPEERMEVASAICEMYATDKYTIASCCKKHGISETTFREWRNEVAEVADLYKKAKSDAISSRKDRIQEKALVGLEKLVTGFKATETTSEPIINRKESQYWVLTVSCWSA